ncbi:helix-turn-helix domain-containing protein [Pseudomonas caspiana]|uniref:Helix-turn-helix domain-containing protein n=1 Tax=Pseudomonas mandelii TaxID=75612 RepID=A0A502I263_9PSED|nr:helix-turn-helix domain-containing protein [Pseudomonas mandelii]TPG93325.1 helix-turn-helix domain-containing protein [Pseudomonas caspiana]
MVFGSGQIQFHRQLRQDGLQRRRCVAIRDTNGNLVLIVERVRPTRLQRACRRLLRTEMSVADIGFEVGYENLSSFNNHFRIEMEQSPSIVAEQR